MEQCVEKWKEKVFYIAYFLYLTATVLQFTMFTQYALLAKVFVLMRYLAFLLAGVKLLGELYLIWKHEEALRQGESKLPWYKMQTFRRGGLYLVIMSFMGVNALATGERTLLFVACLLLAGTEQTFSEISQKTFLVQRALLVAVVLASSFNIIPDLLFKRDVIPIRHALGYTYPSVMVTCCMFLFLLYIWIKDAPLTDRECLWAEVINFLIYKLTDSKTGFLLAAMVILAVWAMGRKEWLDKGKNWFQDLAYREKFAKAYVHIYDYLALYLSAFMGLCCLLYPLKAIQLLDRLLTNRIYYTVNALKNYGIHFWGNKIQWIGFGGSLDTDSLLSSYNFVDSSYAYILINYGVFVFVLTMLLVVLTCKKIRKTQSGLRQFIFAIVLLYCFIEPKLLALEINTFLFLCVEPIKEWYPGAKQAVKTLILKIKEWCKNGIGKLRNHADDKKQEV